MHYRGFKLDPFQVEAIGCLTRHESVIVSAPTGSGKTLIAEYALDKALEGKRRLIYTAPIKALSNQKYRDFSAQHGDRIGVVTGDVAINPHAQILIMTTEIFRNTVFEDPARLNDVDYVIFDEVHFIDDPERGTVWEESLIFAPPHIRFLCLSATVPNLKEFSAWLTEIRKEPFHTVISSERIVPLRHFLFIQGHGVGTLDDLRHYDALIASGKLAHWEDWKKIVPPEQADLLSPRSAGRWRHALVDHLIAENRLPGLYFIFNRRECAERATENLNRELLTPAEAGRIRALWKSLAERHRPPDDSTTRTLGKLICRGIAYHHAGMLPTLKEIVERCFTSGLIKLLFATETFALGINMPARTVVLDTLHKFDGTRRSFLKTRDYQQMAGRAGRRGMDVEGFVYANVEWPFARHEQVERVLMGQPEPLRSQFNLSYSTLLNLYRQLGDRIFEACEKSFANFGDAAHPPPSARQPKAPKESATAARHRRGRGGHGGKPPPPPAPEVTPYWGMVDQVKRRLAVLNSLDYIRDGKLTAKGEFASRVNGYELPLTELVFRNVFDPLSEEQICVVACAVLFESKRSAWYREPPKHVLGRAKRAAWNAVQPIVARETESGVREQTKGMDFRLGAAMHSWATGVPFASLERDTNATDGDIVRTVRQTVQFLRQIERAIAFNDEEVAWVLPEAHLLRQKIERAIRRIKRDEIDAEKQLRLADDAFNAGVSATPSGVMEPPPDPSASGASPATPDRADPASPRHRPHAGDDRPSGSGAEPSPSRKSPPSRPVTPEPIHRRRTPRPPPSQGPIRWEDGGPSSHDGDKA